MAARGGRVCPNYWDKQNHLPQVAHIFGLAEGDSEKAERSGFEPEMPFARHTGLAIRRFRPLSHLSIQADNVTEWNSFSQVQEHCFHVLKATLFS